MFHANSDKTRFHTSEGCMNDFLSNINYNRISKKDHSEGHNEILSSERSWNEVCSHKNDSDFCDVILACQDIHSMTHKVLISKPSKRSKMKISQKREDQNFVFHVF